MKNNINLEDAVRFLQILDEGGSFTFQTLNDKKESKLPIRVLHGTLNEHAEELQQLNELCHDRFNR
jgi:glutamate mutase epsilon subunit